MIYILVTKDDSRDDYKNWYYFKNGEEKLQLRVIASVCVTQKNINYFQVSLAFVWRLLEPGFRRHPQKY